jgi:short-subunit dehydrogenase
VLRSALLRRLVVRPEHVARHVVRMVERDRRESFVPAYYRIAAVAQALFPGLVARVVGRAGYR